MERLHRVRAVPGRPWIVLPTFDEAENLESIVAAIVPILREAVGRDAFRVLVVDDDSPDGTGAIADGLAGELGEVRVLHRTVREGLGPAYLAGFAEALAGGASHVVEMDADFSHEPQDLPRLLAAADGCRPRARLAIRRGRRGGGLGHASGA